MSSSHDDHHTTEQKPVAFTVPLIMASVLVLIIVLFLSLCDPKPHHGQEAGHDHMAPTEAVHEGASNTEAHGGHTATDHQATGANEEMHMDSASAETNEPAAEPAHH